MMHETTNIKLRN